MHFLLELCELCPEIHLQLEALGGIWGGSDFQHYWHQFGYGCLWMFMDICRLRKNWIVIRWSMTTVLLGTRR